MIRIDLGRARRAAARTTSRTTRPRFTIAIAAILVVEVGGFAAHYYVTSRALDAREDDNRELRAKIAPLAGEPAELDRLREQTRQAESKLASLRTAFEARERGPLRRLVDLSKLLGPNWRPNDAPSTRFNPGWRTENVWLSLYEEAGAKIRIEGHAVAHADFNELTNRLELSSAFESPEPLKGKTERDDVSFVVQVRAQ